MSGINKAYVRKSLACNLGSSIAINQREGQAYQVVDSMLQHLYNLFLNSQKFHCSLVFNFSFITLFSVFNPNIIKSYCYFIRCSIIGIISCSNQSLEGTTSCLHFYSISGSCTCEYYIKTYNKFLAPLPGIVLIQFDLSVVQYLIFVYFLFSFSFYSF